MFNETLLRHAIELQQSIENLVTKNNYTLTDVCFAPLSTENEKVESSSKCVVQSFFGFFQNDDSNFDEDYLDKIYKCSK